MGSLIDELRECNSQLRVELYGDVVKAPDCGFGENYDISVVFYHDKGKIEYGSNHPTRREYLVERFADNGWEQLTYEEKKLKISDFCDDDGLLGWNRRWFESNDNQEVDKSTDTEERLNQWLDEEIEDNGDGNVLEYVVSRSSHSVSEFLPGLEIYDFLSETERADIGMTQGSIGGPASGDVLASVVRDVDKLKELLVRHDLPFYFKSEVKS